MRNLSIMVALVVGLGVTASATAFVWWPPKVIIGYGGNGGTTTNAMVDEGCVLPDEVVCPCVPGMRLLDSCLHSGVEIGCLTPDMTYHHVDQSVPVLNSQSPLHVLGGLVCTGIDDTAYVVLPPPGQLPKEQLPKK